MLPAMVSDPFAVVTVQSPTCAAGFDRTQCTTSMLDLIFALVIVVESELTDDLLTFRMLFSIVAYSAAASAFVR